MAKREKERAEPSVVEDHGLYANSCGYCKSDAKTSVSYGLWAHSLSVYDYQDLLNRGWRRSGMLLYKPEMAKTCCPAYTIRLKVDSFLPSKEQNRVMHRMQRYLDGTYNGPISTSSEDAKVTSTQDSSVIEAHDISMVEENHSSGMDCEVLDGRAGSSRGREDTDDIAKDLSFAVKSAVQSCFSFGPYATDLEVPKVTLQRVKPSFRKRIKTSAGEIVYTCNIAFLCAAAIGKDQALRQDDMSVERKRIGHNEVSPVTLAELFASKLGTLHGLEVEACKGHLNFFSRIHDGCSPSVHPSHIANNADITNSQSTKEVPVRPHPSVRSQSRRVLEVRMKRSSFDPEEFALYKRYQIAVHHDKPEDVKENSYVRFLVNTPLKFVPPSKSGGGSSCGFGSFHQQYRIDGRLVAVGVVDILPCCLSSKYLFWDPDLAFLSLGKYSALQEIEWVRKVHMVCPSLEYYYLGYYIHSCPKMRYKGAYQPSELLCPVKFQWVPFDLAEPLLDRQPYACLSDCLEATTSQKYVKGVCMKDKTTVSIEGSTVNNELMDAGEHERLEVLQYRGAASGSKESEDVSNVLLKLGNRFLQFKHLQSWRTVPEKFIDALAYDLRKYSQVVGPDLKTKMAYNLG